jgi:hypothetical protein
MARAARIELLLAAAEHIIQYHKHTSTIIEVID